MLKKLREFAAYLNTRGIVLPWLRDPKTGSSSVSLTLTVVSFGVCILGLLGKATRFLDGVDVSDAKILFAISSSLYFSRKLSTSMSKEVSITNTEVVEDSENENKQDT
jgi:hypothetical protein